ncbi:MAG: LptF/LptG family permease [Alphaproteobacteria bacterium]|nr:LptF/LptG family permease [Alphaproteobacteria bacterium]
MNRIDRYILRQMITPLIFGTIVITLVVWLTQTLQRLELVIEHGEGIAAFIWLTLLIIPSLLVIVLPFAVFGATLYTLQRLHADSEISVMFAAGYSKLRIVSPVVIVAFAAALATLWINVDLMPRSYRELKRQVAEIRADLAAMALRAGEFTKFGDGFTVYVEQSLPNGAFRGLIVNDYRDPDDEETYMARYGLLRDTEDGPYLFLSDGNIQSYDRKTGAADIVVFEQTAVNVESLAPQRNGVQLEVTERYPHELFNPDMTNEWDRRNAGRLIAEGHARLASPFYPIAYVLLAAYALLGGPYSRRGYLTRIAVAVGAASGLRIAAFVAQSAAGENVALVWTLYALPIVPTFILFALLSDGFRGERAIARLRRQTRRRRRRKRFAVSGA